MSTIEEIRSGLCLRVMEGSHQQEIHNLTRTVVSIGRTTPETPYSPAYMTFPEPTLSRLHAVLSWDPEQKTYVAHHKSQTNPTLINGRHLTKPVTLTPGDTLALGRLVIVLDVAKNQGGDTESLTPPPTLHIQIKCTKADRSYRVPVDHQKVKLQFLDSRGTASITPEERTDEYKLVRIPAYTDNELSFTFLSDSEAQIETSLAEPVALRKTDIACGSLSLPLRPGTPIMLGANDTVWHQDHIAQLHKTNQAGYNESTLEGSETIDSKPESSKKTWGGILTFLNGSWAGATVSVPETGMTAFELGPNSTSFYHPSPLQNCPTCRVIIQNGRAQLQVVSQTDDQFVDVDGELFFPGESTPLFSGTKILLSEAEFVWTNPGLASVYSRFELVGPDGSHPITKQRVRLGTAAHCEARFDLPSLAPVVGTLTFGKDGLFYRHQNIALPAIVDGAETSAGLEASVRPGSKLELAPGVIISIEETRSGLC